MKYVLLRLNQNENVKINRKGNSLELLTMLVAATSMTAKTISKEKNISFDKAVQVIYESIKEHCTEQLGWSDTNFVQ